MKKLFLNGMFLLMAVMASVGFVSCDEEEDDTSKEVDVQEIKSKLRGTWEVLMDDPSWKTVLTLNANNSCTAVDYYDINGDFTFSEYGGTYHGYYTVTSDKISFYFDDGDDTSVVEGSYEFTDFSSSYFEAMDRYGDFIYASKSTASGGDLDNGDTDHNGNTDVDDNADKDDDPVATLDLVGTWEVLMDDPSWKTVLTLDADGSCTALDFYDIDLDLTFSEYDGAYRGTYSVTGNRMSIQFNDSYGSVVGGLYEFTKVSSSYFEARDSYGGFIYATKRS